MPAAAPTQTYSPAAPAQDGSALASVIAEARESATPTAAAPTEVTHSAERAVEAVLTAAERFANGDRHAVNLEFSFGGRDLHVRVEMRAEQVHTAFHTASEELRAALTQEWQAVAAHSADRSLRFVEPVFSSSGSGDFNSSGFSDDKAWQQQREPAPGREAPGFFASHTRSSKSTTVATQDAAIAPPSVPAWFGPARRLQTFA